LTIPPGPQEEIPGDGTPQEVPQPEVVLGDPVEPPVGGGGGHQGGEDLYHLVALLNFGIHVLVAALGFFILALPALILAGVVHFLEAAGVSEAIVWTFVVIEHVLFFLDVWFFLLWLAPTVLVSSAKGLRWVWDSLWEAWAILRYGHP
jgi:hypothetical protein